VEAEGGVGVGAGEAKELTEDELKAAHAEFKEQVGGIAIAGCVLGRRVLGGVGEGGRVAPWSVGGGERAGGRGGGKGGRGLVGAGWLLAWRRAAAAPTLPPPCTSQVSSTLKPASNLMSNSPPHSQ